MFHVSVLILFSICLHFSTFLVFFPIVHIYIYLFFSKCFSCFSWYLFCLLVFKNYSFPIICSYIPHYFKIQILLCEMFLFRNVVLYFHIMFFFTPLFVFPFFAPRISFLKDMVEKSTTSTFICHQSVHKIIMLSYIFTLVCENLTSWLCQKKRSAVKLNK